MLGFSQKLKSLRIKYDLTLEELANNIGTTKATLSRYENSDRSPNVEILIRLADYFNVTTDYLLGRHNINLDILTDATKDDDNSIILTKEDQNKAIDLINTFVRNQIPDKLRLSMLNLVISNMKKKYFDSKES